MVLEIMMDSVTCLTAIFEYIKTKNENWPTMEIYYYDPTDLLAQSYDSSWNGHIKKMLLGWHTNLGSCIVDKF